MASLSFAILNSGLCRPGLRCQQGSMAEDLRSCDGGRAGWTLITLITLCLAPNTHLAEIAMVTGCQSSVTSSLCGDAYLLYH